MPHDKVEDKVEPKKAKPSKKAVRSVQVVPARKARKVSFEAWASERGIKAHHLGGMRAHLKHPNKLMTLEAWDSAFVDY